MTTKNTINFEYDIDFQILPQFYAFICLSIKWLTHEYCDQIKNGTWLLILSNLIQSQCFICFSTLDVYVFKTAASRKKLKKIKNVRDR